MYLVNVNGDSYRAKETKGIYPNGNGKNAEIRSL